MTYLIVGPYPVYGHPPGSVCELTLTKAQERHLIVAGHLRLCDPPEPIEAVPARPRKPRTPRRVRVIQEVPHHDEEGETP